MMIVMQVIKMDWEIDLDAVCCLMEYLLREIF